MDYTVHGVAKSLTPRDFHFLKVSRSLCQHHSAGEVLIECFFSFYFFSSLSWKVLKLKSKWRVPTNAIRIGKILLIQYCVYLCKFGLLHNLAWKFQTVFQCIQCFQTLFLNNCIYFIFGCAGVSLLRGIFVQLVVVRRLLIALVSLVVGPRL